MDPDFEWDNAKDEANQAKHGVSFSRAQMAFLDASRVVLEDAGHSAAEDRYFCIGRIPEGILTVRFTYRNKKIRIFGAGFWRKGKAVYDEQNS